MAPERPPTAQCLSPTRQNSRSALYTSPTKDQDEYQDCGKRRETIQDACRPLAERQTSSCKTVGRHAFFITSHTDKCQNVKRPWWYSPSSTSARGFQQRFAISTCKSRIQSLLRRVACRICSNTRGDCTHSKHNFIVSHHQPHVHPEQPKNDAAIN